MAAGKAHQYLPAAAAFFKVSLPVLSPMSLIP